VRIVQVTKLIVTSSQTDVANVLQNTRMAATIRSYRDLIAWQRGMELVVDIYEMTRSFPECERYGLSSQLRRSAVSVPSNIAEGQGRLSHGEFKQFLGHARGSLSELETQVSISARLGYLTESQTEHLMCRCSSVGKVLNGLLNSLK
jgi:four helix bundle protein